MEHGRGLLLRIQTKKPVLKVRMDEMKVTVKQISLVPPKSSLNTVEEWSVTLNRLQNGLAQVLDHFHPVAGRLFVTDDGIMGADYNGKGVMFIEAHADIALDDIPCKDGDFKLPVDFLMSLTQTGGHALKWPWSSDAPLFFLQATRFSCGGLCISMKFNHQVLDGTSAWHFFKSWAETCRGVKLSTEPTFSENPINLCQSGQRKLNVPPHLKVLRKTALLSSTLENPDTYRTESFFFTKDMIHKLKAEKPGFTTFQLLTAHLWEKITVARNLDETDCTTLHFAVNCRGRVPSLGPAYCGQGALIIGVSTTAGQVGQLGATLLKRTVASFSEREVKQYSELVEAYAMDKEYTIHSNNCAGKDIVVGSSFHFPVYEDFGFGKPVGMTIIPTPNDGRLYYFPGNVEGSVVAYISLKVATMERLKPLL